MLNTQNRISYIALWLTWSVGEEGGHDPAIEPGRTSYIALTSL